MTSPKKQKLVKTSIGSTFMTVVIAIMIFASEIFGEKEIIFPEVAAICVGSFIVPHVMWKSSFIKIIIFVAICAVLGVLVVKYLHITLWVQFIIAFMIAQIVFFFSKTGFAPMISAMALPVLIQTESPIYIISAVALTTFVIVLTVIHQKYVLKEKKETIKVQIPLQEFIKSFIFRTVIVGVVAFACSFLTQKVKFCMAPPLLVAFTEMTTKKNMPALKRPVMTIILFTGCAFIGASCRYIISMQCGIPLTISVLVVCVGIIILMEGIKLFFPPAAAMGVLSMLIPENVVLLYPLDVFIGISIWVISALLFKKVFNNKDHTAQSTKSEKEAAKAMEAMKNSKINEEINKTSEMKQTKVDIEIKNERNEQKNQNNNTNTNNKNNNNNINEKEEDIINIDIDIKS